MKRPVLLALAVLLLLTACPTTRGSRKPTDLPFDPAVRTGVLANGLTYYIRANDKPEKRVELRLAVNAGSVLEDDNQLGIAHFLEHLAFNGTTHFKKNELVSALEEMGMRFGGHLNASTSYDETVYRLQVPADNEKGLDTGLLILEDWAHGIVLDDAEVEKERKVILEEWRSDRGADERIREEHLKTLFSGSRYLQRRPIGSMEVVASVKPETIRKFYTDWYRPDLMAVIVVGSVDPAAVELKIKERFGGIAQPFFPRPRLEYGVPSNSFTTASVVVDNEATSTSFRVYYRRPVRPLLSEADYRVLLTESLFHSLLSARLDELAQLPATPFLEAYSAQGRIVRGMEATVLGAGAKEGRLEEALESVLTEVERARRFGFTASEIERQKKEMLAGIERSYAERDKRNSATLAQEYIRHYLEQEASPGIEYEYGLYRKHVPKISAREINALAARLFPDDDRVVLAGAPEKAGARVPAVRDLLAVFGRVKAAALEPYADDAPDQPLVAVPPARGSVVAEEKDEALGLVVWKLSNGAQVTVKPTDFKNDEVVMRAFSYGGHSLAADADYHSAAAAADLVTLSGLGDFSRPALDKKLAGIQAAVAPRIDEITEGLAGSARPGDIATLFELTWLYFTAPRIDPDAFLSYKEKMATALVQRQGSPEAAFSDELQIALTQNHRRGRPIVREDLERVDADAALRFYRDRFGDASDFRFYFTGNIDPAALKPLVETWIGGLPGAGRRETWKDTGMRRPKTKIERDLRLGRDPKSQTVIAFVSDFSWSLRDLTVLRALSETADLRLNAVIREQEGGTYGIGAADAPQRLPREEALFYVQFGADPARIGALTDRVFTELDSFKTKGPTEQELRKAREIVLKEREVSLKSNVFWAEVLKNYAIWGEPSRRIVEYADLLARVTVEDVRAAAKKYLNRDRSVRVTLYPEVKK